MNFGFHKAGWLAAALAGAGLAALVSSAGDQTRVRQARDQLMALYPRSDAEANQIYDNILARYNHERSSGRR